MAVVKSSRVATKSNVDPKQAEFLAWARADFRRFCGLLEIQPKGGGGRIPFKLSAIQREYCAARTSRDIILKPRQIYMTTLECARDLWIFLTRQGARVVIVCQSSTDQSAFKDISYKMRLFIDSLRRVGAFPEFTTEAAGEWAMASRDATMRIIQAGASDASAAKKGRGGTINRLHITEASFFEHAEVTFNSLLESVGAPTDTEIVNESTPNGAGGHYYEQWQAAVHGKNGYSAHFFPWWQHDEYQLPLVDGETFRAESEREQALIEAGVTHEQLKWYRQKVAEKGQALTDQEYPSNPEECFLVSGRAFFDQQTTSKLLKMTREPVEVYDRARVRIFDEPEHGRSYVLAVDTSEGAGLDPSAGIVYERETGRHMATIDGQYGPVDLAHESAKLGRKYFDALIAVERNNHGHAVLLALQNIEQYLEVFIRPEDMKPGFLTNTVTRPLMLDALEDDHRKETWSSPDRALLAQMRTFVVGMNGKPEGARGEHDDLVMAAAIGWQVRQIPKVDMRVGGLTRKRMRSRGGAWV